MKFGKQAFDFIPDTFVIPDEFNEFCNFYGAEKKKTGKSSLWIVKP